MSSQTSHNRLFVHGLIGFWVGALFSLIHLFLIGADSVGALAPSRRFWGHINHRVHHWHYSWLHAPIRAAQTQGERNHLWSENSFGSRCRKSASISL